MKPFLHAALFASALVTASASPITFVATLTGSQETPPTTSPGIGISFVVLNSPQDMITVDLTFANLVAPATAAHIHGPAAPGTPAPVVFPLAGVPAATFGTLPTQTFPVMPAQVTQLESGLWYVNVHSATYPGGEIRGQLLAAASAVPEPATATLLAAGMAGLLLELKRRRAS